MKSGGGCLGAALASTVGWGKSPDEDALQQWIDRNSVRINPDHGKEEFAGDFERLIPQIGEARIVMFGEPSHGAGSAFSAKARLVQFLHERLGFDVLVWESGFIDLERTEAGLRGELDPVAAAQLGILTIWSSSTECRPLFAYAKSSHGSPRPLTMAGFDMQLTAPGTLDYFSAELHAFADTLDSVVRGRARPLAEDLLTHFALLDRYAEALATKAAELGRAGIAGDAQGTVIRAWNQSEGDALRPKAEDLNRLEEAAEALDRLLQGNGDGEAFTPGGRAGFMIRAIASLAGYGANLFEAYGKHSADEAARYALTGENRRDRINAENLRWLIDNAYSGHKIMVWAHNAHVMNAWYKHGFDGVSLEPVIDGMKPMGVWLAGWYGDALYQVGLTAYQGSDGWAGTTPTPVPPAPLDSLEERLHRLAAPEVFLPLHGNSAIRSLSARPVSMRIPKYKTETWRC